MAAREFLRLTSLRQAFQVPPDGFRDGYLGDDIPPDSAKESLQINLLPCTF